MKTHSDREKPFETLPETEGRAAIVRFVRGLRAHRTNPVTAKAIKTWLAATDASFVNRLLTALVVDEALVVQRTSLLRHRAGYSGGYVYAIGPHANSVLQDDPTGRELFVDPEREREARKRAAFYGKPIGIRAEIVAGDARDEEEAAVAASEP